MANMSYCRFYNTNIDLRDCLETVCGRLDGSYEYPVSEGECDSFKSMVYQMFDFLNDAGLIEECGLNEEVLEDMIRKMRNEPDEED